MEIWQDGKLRTLDLQLAPRDEVAIYKQELALAEQGNPQAQTFVASRLVSGLGVGKNPSEAVRWKSVAFNRFQRCVGSGL